MTTIKLKGILYMKSVVVIKPGPRLTQPKGQVPGHTGQPRRIFKNVVNGCDLKIKSKFRIDCTSCKFVVSSSSRHQHFRSSHTCHHLLRHGNPSAHFPEHDPNCSFPPTYLPETSVFLVCERERRYCFT